MFVTLAAAFSLALIAIYYWLRYYYSDKMKYLRALPTGASTLPLLGHLHYILFTGEGPETAVISGLKFICSLQQRLFCMWLGPSPMVILNNPEDVQIVLNNSRSLHKGADYQLLKCVFGEGLLTAEVPHWKATRRHMMSLFHPQNLDHLVLQFNKSSEQLVQQISTKIGQGPIDIYDYFLDFAIRNVVCLTLGSQSGDEMDSKITKRLREGVTLGGRLTGVRAVKPWLKSDLLFHFLYNKDVQYTLDVVKNLPESALKAIEDYGNTQLQSTDNIEPNEKEIPTQLDKRDVNKYPTTIPDIYKTIREKPYPIKKEDLIHELVTIFITGTDTVSTTTSNCLLALAAHPYIQERLYNEIVEEVGEEGMVTSEDLKKLKYLDCVVKETLRLFTTVPIIVRSSEIELKLGGFKIPAGTDMMINIFGMHHDSQVYPDPERFDPERFMDGNNNQRHLYSFIPFSAGARNCIGKPYGLLSMKIALIHLLREYKVSTPVDINTLKFNFELIKVPHGEHQIAFERRKKFN